MIGITGGSGLIGSHLVSLFLKESIHFSSFGLKRLTFSPLETFHSLDLNEFSIDVLRSNLDGIQSFIHLAARLPSAGNQDYTEAKVLLNTNASASFGLLHACREAGVGKFIYLSSASIMQPLSKSITSTSYFSSSLHSTAYSVSKLAGELLCWNQRTNDFNVSILRPASVYGYGMRSGVVKKFIESILADIPVSIYGNGTWASDLVCADDVAGIILHSLRYNLITPLNIGTGILTSIYQLAITICELCNKSVSLVCLEDPSGTGSLSAGLSPVDPSEAESFMGRKMLGLRDGLSRMIYGYQSR